jgi:hypothetical protein
MIMGRFPQTNYQFSHLQCHVKEFVARKHCHWRVLQLCRKIHPLNVLFMKVIFSLNSLLDQERDYNSYIIVILIDSISLLLVCINSCIATHNNLSVVHYSRKTLSLYLILLRCIIIIITIACLIKKAAGQDA